MPLTGIANSSARSFTLPIGARFEYGRRIAEQLHVETATDFHRPNCCRGKPPPRSARHAP